MKIGLEIFAIVIPRQGWTGLIPTTVEFFWYDISLFWWPGFRRSGLQIKIKIWVSIRKMWHRLWIFPAISRFAVGLKLPIYLTIVGFRSETLLQNLGFRHYFWVTRTSRNPVILSPEGGSGQWSWCQPTFLLAWQRPVFSWHGLFVLNKNNKTFNSYNKTHWTCLVNVENVRRGTQGKPYQMSGEKLKMSGISKKFYIY